MPFRIQLYNDLHTAYVYERLRFKFWKQPANFKMTLLVHLLVAILFQHFSVSAFAH